MFSKKIAAIVRLATVTGVSSYTEKTTADRTLI